MVITKLHPVGIDRPIQELQLGLFEYIMPELGIENEDYQSYGRAYKNVRAGEEGLVAEVYSGKGEYRDAYLDDQNKIASFFVVPDTISVDTDQGQNTAQVGIIFMMNLSRFAGYVPTQRNDEEIRNTIMKYFTTPVNGASLTGVVTGQQQVFAEFTAWRNKSELKFQNIHPWHCFRLNIQLIYSNSNC